MKRFSGWLKEPLFHFFILGLLLFAAYSWFSSGKAAGDREIIVSQGRIQNLAEIFSRTWQRPPTPEELQGLIQEFIRDEIYYREGLRLGLDQDDIVVKRRIRQKMEFISEGEDTRTEPSDAQLEKFLREKPETFHTEPQFSFRQIYLNPDRRGTKVKEDAQTLLEKIKSEPNREDALNLGDASLLKPQYQELSSREAAGLFGEYFVRQLSQIPLQQWSGPVASGYGLHLIWIDNRSEGRLPKLEEIREAVEREWNYQAQQIERERFYQELLKIYQIKIDSTPPAKTAKSEDESL